MQNADGDNVDLYIPRKCSWSNRILAANDFGSVQVNIADVDPVTGKFTRTFSTVAISGFVRAQAESDEAISTLSKKFDSSK